MTNRLLAKIAERSTEGGRNLIVTPRRSWSVEDYLRSVPSWARGSEKDKFGQRFGIYLGSQEATILLMIILDGHATRLTLLPPDLALEDLESVLARAEVDWVISERELGAQAVTRPSEVLGGDYLNKRVRKPKADISEVHGGVSTEWIIPTSGTTGTPDPVRHNLESLTRSIPSESKGRAYTWGLMYSVYRFAGLQVFLHSLLTGGALLVPDGVENLEERMRFFGKHGCDAISATPTKWRRLLMTQAGKALSLRQVTLGGEIADAGILKSLKETYPEAHITHIYASTEVGVGFAVHDGQEGFPASYLTDPPGETEIAVDEDGHLLLRPPVGGDDSSEVEKPEDGRGWIDTKDLVRRDGGRFVFVGREDGALNVGGNIVYPEEVERVVTRVEGVAAAAVSGLESSLVGQLVKVRIVPDEEAKSQKVLQEKIIQECKQHLPGYKRPVDIEFVDRIPTTAAGKTSRGFAEDDA